RARRRTARHALGTGVPRVAGRAVMRVQTFRPIRKLHHVKLAEDDRARLAQTTHDRRIRLRHTAGQDLGPRRGGDAGRVIEVFQRNRPTVQRPRRTPCDQRGLGGLCRGHGGVAAHGEIGAQHAVVRGDSLEVHARHLDRRDLLARDHSRQVRDRGERQVRAHRIRYCVVGSTASSGRASSVASSRCAAATAGRSASSSSAVQTKPATRAARESVSASNTSPMARSLTRYAGDQKAALLIRRRTVWLIALIVLVALASVGAAVVAWAPEIVRHTAMLRLESLTHRRVSIDRVELSLFTGHVAVHGLRVAERDGPGMLAVIDRLEGRVRRRSLWSLHVWIEELSITGTEIHVTRLSPTRFNISDLLERPEQPRTRLPVTIERLRVTDGALIFDDRTLTPTRRWKVERIDIEGHA